MRYKNTPLDRMPRSSKRLPLLRCLSIKNSGAGLGPDAGIK